MLPSLAKKGAAMQLDQVLMNADSYQILDQLIQGSEVELSFFGSRLVSVRGYDGTVSLDALVEKTFALSQPNANFSIETCKAALQSHVKLIDHYETSDEMIKASWNIFIIFFRNVRSFFESPFMPECIRILLFAGSWRGRLMSSDKYGPEVVLQAESEYGLFINSKNQIETQSCKL